MSVDFYISNKKSLKFEKLKVHAVRLQGNGDLKIRVCDHSTSPHSKLKNIKRRNLITC